MKIKTINVVARKSHAYQTYEYGEIIEIEPQDNVEFVRKEAQARCRKAVMEQINIDGGK
jgi:hypothetical protein